jgi:hypothetical protein
MHDQTKIGLPYLYVLYNAQPTIGEEGSDFVPTDGGRGQGFFLRGTLAGHSIISTTTVSPSQLTHVRPFVLWEGSWIT